MQSRLAPLTLVATLFAGPSLAAEDHPLLAEGTNALQGFLCALPWDQHGQSRDQFLRFAEVPR